MNTQKTVYRYFKEEVHALKAINEGLFRFMPLDYYQEIEDRSRQDGNEGQISWKNLRITIGSNGQKLLETIPHAVSFSRVRLGLRPYVLCTSLLCSEDLVRRWGSKYIVEIKFTPELAWEDNFLVQPLLNIDSRFHKENLIHRQVIYYSTDEPHFMDGMNNFPEFFKSENFSLENEYRFLSYMNPAHNQGIDGFLLPINGFELRKCW